MHLENLRARARDMHTRLHGRRGDPSPAALTQEAAACLAEAQRQIGSSGEPININNVTPHPASTLPGWPHA